MKIKPTDGWHDEAAARAVTAVAQGGMPEAAMATYARWWQLETWLRDLVYLELRAKYGAAWQSVVALATGRQRKDGRFTHMSGADSSNPLAYLDYSNLIQVIESNWDLFAHALIEQKSWQGRQPELLQIRHRIAHLRTPHHDDLKRLEQTLRDLELGAHIAYSSYNRRWRPVSWTDAVTDGWLRSTHQDARRLIRHASMQYDTTITVEASARPWAMEKNSTAPPAPGPGFLWHAEFSLRGRSLDIPRLWRDQHLRSVKPYLVHLVALDESAVGFTFSAVDPDTEIADAIGLAFDAVLIAADRGPSELNSAVWRQRAASTDYRVVPTYGWGLVEESMVPISIFAAGGAVHDSPTW